MPPQDDQKKGPPAGFVLDQDRDYPEAAPAGTARAVPAQPATSGWDTAKRALRFVADPAMRAAYSWAAKDLPPPRLPAEERPAEERPREAPAAAPTKPAKPAAAPRGDQGALEKTFDIAAQQSGHMLSEAQKEALRTAYGIATMHLPRSRAEFQAEYVEPFRRAARETPPGAGLGERMARGAAAGLIPSVGEAAGRGDISGAVGRAAGQLGAFGALGELGRGAPEGPAPAPAPATLPRTRGGLPPVPRVTTADMAGILEREMNRPAPSATEQLEAGAQGIFRKPYGQLTPEQQRVVARGLGGPPGGVERRTTVGEAPTAERRAGAMPLPTNAPPAGAPAFTIEERGGIRWAKSPGVNDVSIPPRLTDPAQVAAYVAEKQALQRQGVPSLGGAGGTLTPTTKAAPAAPAAAPGVPGTLPRIPAPTALPAGAPAVPPATLDEILRQATGQPEPRKPEAGKPLRGQPGVTERAPPEEDPLKREFPDPATRRLARANGAEFLRTGAAPEVLQAVHDLKNWEIREAAVNAGIDVGTKHVGSRMALGPEQVARQDLIDQMIRQGIKPEDLPRLAQPQTRTIAAGDLKVGDTFVDDTGGPRRVVEITPRGHIRTADGSVRTYRGNVEIRGTLNDPRAQLARGGKFIASPPEVQSGFARRELPNVPPELEKYLEPDEIEFLRGRPILQRNMVNNYRGLKPSLAEAATVARAGHGLGGWWQRFIDTFAALGEPTEGLRDLDINHIENLKAFHGALSGNKAVEQANRIAWGAYRDWL